MTKTVQLLVLILLMRRTLGAKNDDLATRFPSASPSQYTRISEFNNGIVEYFSRRTTTIHVDFHISPESKVFHFMMDHLNYLTRNSNLTFIVNRQGKASSNSEFYYNNIFFVDSPEGFREIVPQVSILITETTGYFLVLLLSMDPMVDSQRVFEIAFEKNIYNIAIITTLPTANVTVLTYFPFEKGRCRQVEATIIGFFRNGGFTTEFFPPKFKNFHQCPIHIYARIAEAFYSIDDRTKRAVGLDAELINLLGEFLNFQPVVKTDPLGQFKPLKLPDKSIIMEPYYLLRNKTVDALLGSFFYKPDCVSEFPCSKIYHSIPVRIVVWRSKEEMYSINHTWFLDPFHRTTWNLLVFSFFFIVTALRFLKTLSIHKSQRMYLIAASALDIYAALLNNARVMARSHDRLRFGIIFICFGFTLLNLAYQGKLYVNNSYVLRPYKQTLDDLYQDGYKFLIRDSDNLETLTVHFNIPKNKIRTTRNNTTFEMLHTLARLNGKYVLLETNGAVLHNAKIADLLDRLYLLPYVIKTHHLCGYFHQGSFLKKPFDDVLNVLSAHGFFNKWLNDVKRGIHFSKGNLRHGQSITPLSWDFFQPLLCLYGIMISMALISFGLETLFRVRAARKLKFLFR